MTVLDQYREAKSLHPGMILLFRKDDFYELYEDDAKTVAKMFKLPLCHRQIGLTAEVTPMVGFAHRLLEKLLRTLLHKGHRVAICDQVEEVPQDRTVQRVVVPNAAM